MDPAVANMTSVIARHVGRVATLTLNRPHRLNAINSDMLSSLDAALRAACEAARIDVIVLEGAGSSFCSGDDLVELAAEPPTASAARAAIDLLQDITRHMMLGDKTVVCSVRGWAIGGGASWPLNADLAVWSEDARLRFPEAGHALFPSGGATWLLGQYCGPHRAAEILLSGETLDARQLLAERILHRAVPKELLEAETTARVEHLLSLARGTLVRYKRARAQIIEAPLEKALETERGMLVQAVAALTS